MNTPARSMTGFASTTGTLPDGRTLHVTLKSVNHRNLDLQVRVPAGLERVEAALRQAVKASARRGHVELTLSLEKAAEQAAAVQVNQPLLEAYLQAYRETAARLDLTAPPDLHVLLRLPGVLQVGTAPVAANVEQASTEEIVPLVLQALEQFQAARALEGAALVEELRGYMARLRELAQQVAALREGILEIHTARLRDRMQTLLHGLEVDPARLLTEAALLAERGDVTEEMVRIHGHLDRFVSLLDAGGELGKPLDFLLQELNREVNTTLSKTGGSMGETGLRLTGLGLAMKTEVERAREQVQNLE